MNVKKRKIVVELVVGVIWVWGAIWGVRTFNQFILMSLPLWARMFVMSLSHLIVAVGPIVIAFISKDKLTDFGFSKKAMGKQIFLGIALGIAMSIVFTLSFHLLGLGDWVNNGKDYSLPWQFIYEFFYCIVAIGITEEFIFRGFFYNRLSKLSDALIAVWVSVLL